MNDENRCCAHMAIRPDASLDERRCRRDAGRWVYAAEDGPRPLTAPFR